MTEDPEANPGGEQPASHEAAGGASRSWDDLQTGFSGNPKTRLDERCRLKMPADFKAFIEKKYGKDFNAFYITSRDGETAEIYPMPEWVRHHGKIANMPPSDTARNKLLASYNLYGDRVDMDPQGRLLIPEELRNEGVLVGDVKVSGEGHFLRVSSLKKLRETVKSNVMTPAELDSLNKHGV